MKVIVLISAALPWLLVVACPLVMWWMIGPSPGPEAGLAARGR